MITINKKLNIQGGEPPYSYVVNLEGSAITNSPTNEEVEVTLQFDTEDNLDATLVGFDSNGCSFTYNFNIQTPCDTFTVSEIQRTNNTYSVITTSECEVTYEWDYPSSFQGLVNNNQITLNQLINTNQDTLTLTATDCNGCEEVRTYELDLCNVVAQAAEGDLVSTGTSNNPASEIGLEDTFQYKVDINLSATSSCSTINWNSLVLLQDYEFTISGSKLTIFTNVQEGFTVNYQVTDNLGIVSNVATITVNSNVVSGLQLRNKSITSTSNNITLDLDEELYFGAEIDFDSITILSPNDNNVTYNSSVRQFNIPSSSSGVFRWTAKDTNGNLAINVSTITVIRLTGSASFNDVITSATCGETNKTTDATAGQDIVTISKIGGNGSVSGDNVTVARGQYIELKGIDSVGREGEYNVYVCDNCGGNDILVTTCESTVDLSTYITDPNFIAWETWPVETGQPTPSVTFPSDGTYEFTYSIPGQVFDTGVTCTSKFVKLIVTKEASQQSSGNLRSNITTLSSNTQPNNYPYFTSTQDNFITSCANLVTAEEQNFSTNINYDKFYIYSVIPVTLDNVANYTMVVEVSSAGLSNPLNAPKLRLERNATAIQTVNYGTGSNASISFNFNKADIDNNGSDFIMQVGGNNQGNYIISVNIIEI